MTREVDAANGEEEGGEDDVVDDGEDSDAASWPYLHLSDQPLSHASEFPSYFQIWKLDHSARQAEMSAHSSLTAAFSLPPPLRHLLVCRPTVSWRCTNVRVSTTYSIGQPLLCISHSVPCRSPTILFFMYEPPEPCWLRQSPTK